MDRLHILLGADSLVGWRSGVGRMTLEIARNLQGHPAIAEFELLIRCRVQDPHWLARLETSEAAALPGAPPSAAIPRLKRWLGDHVPAVSAAHRAWRLRQMRQQIDHAGRVAAGRPPVVYHEPNMITQPYDGPIVATFNDLSWHHDPALHPRERISWISRNLPRTIRTATRFIAISAFTKEEMARELGIDPARVDVVHLAPSPSFRPVPADEAAPVLARYELTDQAYLLSISTLEPRKNFDRLLAAYLALPEALRAHTPLVIAGGKGWGSVLARGDAERAAARGQLRLLGHVPDADLVALTARCTAFAYVSLYEGFGLPVIEAMAAGVPVLASANTAVGETAGDAALLADPLDTQAIAAGLRQLLEDDAAREHWRAASLRRAAEFSWRRTVDRMVHTWRQAARDA